MTHRSYQLSWFFYLLAILFLGIAFRPHQPWLLRIVTVVLFLGSVILGIRFSRLNRTYNVPKRRAIFLIGERGSGKSTIGRMIALELDFILYDLSTKNIRVLKEITNIQQHHAGIVLEISDNNPIEANFVNILKLKYEPVLVQIIKGETSLDQSRYFTPVSPFSQVITLINNPPLSPGKVKILLADDNLEDDSEESNLP